MRWVKTFNRCTTFAKKKKRRKEKRKRKDVYVHFPVIVVAVIHEKVKDSHIADLNLIWIFKIFWDFIWIAKVEQFCSHIKAC